MVEVPVKIYVTNLLKAAKDTITALAALSPAAKNRALTDLADRIEKDQDGILAANKLDVDAAGKGLDRATAKRAVERIRINADHIKHVADRLRRIAELPDPVGAVTEMRTRPNGMQVSRVRAPIGVIGVISEYGPEV